MVQIAINASTKMKIPGKAMEAARWTLASMPTFHV
jgi:hypothetical protein